jgi:phosphatidylglycerol---prolipoprotein diacylglyceryl transferase
MFLQIHWNINPEIFRIGGFALRYYTLCFLLAFVAGYWLLSRIYNKEGTDKQLLDKLAIYVFIGTILGARLGHCLFYEFDYYKTRPWEMILPFRWEYGRFKLTGFQGLASHGGAIGILTAVWLYSRKYRIKMLWVLDRLVIVVALAGFFIRVGNFFNSEIIGKPSRLPWAVVFDRIDTTARHPAQLYEALSYAGIFFLLLLLYRRRIAFTKPGFIFGAFLTTVFGLRFCMEFVKEAQEAFEEGMLLNMGQLLSIPLILAGLFFSIRKQKLYG